MDETDVSEALKTVEDPEAGMNIVDLGLVYVIDVEPGKVRVEMTMTSPACPVGAYLVDESAAAIRAVAPPGTDVQVDLVWEPPWTPDRMSPEAQSRFGWSG
jgi:metal-sulfur cluster biosynthetic enzyme